MPAGQEHHMEVNLSVWPALTTSAAGEGEGSVWPLLGIRSCLRLRGVS